MLPDGVVQRHPVERAGVRGGALLRLCVTKPPAPRRFVDTPSSRRPRCMRSRGQQYSSRPGSRSSSAHRVQALLPAAARGVGGTRPGRGQGHRGRWKRPFEFPILRPASHHSDSTPGGSRLTSHFRIPPLFSPSSRQASHTSRCQPAPDFGKPFRTPMCPLHSFLHS